MTKPHYFVRSLLDEDFAVVVVDTLDCKTLVEYSVD
jgi:hypothetical protein